MSQSFDLHQAIREAMNQALKTRGTANLLVAGKTGVGKSTLVNAVFGENFAETAQGRPVTQHIKPYAKQGIPVCIYDTKGLEVKDYAPILKELTEFVQLKNGSKDPSEHIHVAWVCIAEGSRRVEQAEMDLVAQLAKLLPVIAVITTAVSDNGFREKLTSSPL
jgi:predicted GTPase